MDKYRLGLIDSISLAYVLYDRLGVPEDCIAFLIRILDPFRREVVSIEELARLVEDVESVNNLKYFEYAALKDDEAYRQYAHRFEQFYRIREQEKIEEEARRDQIRLKEIKEEQEKLKNKQVEETGSRYSSPVSKARNLMNR